MSTKKKYREINCNQIYVSAYFDTNSFFDRARDDAKHSSFDDNFKMFKTDPLRMHKSTWSAPTTPQHVVAGSSSNSAPSTPPIIPSGSGTASPLATSPSRENQKEFDFAIDNLQSIQQDIIALINRIEDFKGHAKCNEYTYLDEMLTRNLLKLDSIDTIGNVNLRLAKKEAIKCIEQAIVVLEEKASSFSGSSI